MIVYKAEKLYTPTNSHKIIAKYNGVVMLKSKVFTITNKCAPITYDFSSFVDFEVVPVALDPADGLETTALDLSILVTV